MEQERKKRPNRKRIRLPLFSYSRTGPPYAQVPGKIAAFALRNKAAAVRPGAGKRAAAYCETRRSVLN